MNPCIPSPCGPFSQCRVVNSHAVCSCLESYIGSPPSCRPECVISGDCPQNRACIGQKCQDPCPGTCGINAQCQVVNHNPICSCLSGYTGDPFVRCIQQKRETFIFYYLYLSIIEFFLYLLFLLSLSFFISNCNTTWTNCKSLCTITLWP